MNPPTDIAEVMERRRLSAQQPPGTPDARRGTGTAALPLPPPPASAGLPPLPPLPGLPPLPSPDPLPLAEVATMVPRARAKLEVGSHVPGVLRPVFRNQGGFNGILLQTCDRLVEVGQQLTQENARLRERCEVLGDYLAGQNAWLDALARKDAADHDWLLAGHAHAAAQAARLERAEAELGRLRNLAGEHAGARAALEMQSRQLQETLQTLQAQVGERPAHAAEFAAHAARQEQMARAMEEQIQDLYHQSNRHAEHLQAHLQTADVRAAEAAARLERLEAQTEARQSRIDHLHDRVEDLDGQIAGYRAAEDRRGGRLDGLQAFAERLDARHGELLGEGERHAGRVDVLARRLEEAVALCEQARGELKAAISHQHGLQEDARRLDQRQINDASSLRAQLAFQQRVLGHWLAPQLPPGAPEIAGTAAGLSTSSSLPPANAADAPPADDAAAAARHRAGTFFRSQEYDALYLAFENVMRGQRLDIKERLSYYAPRITEAGVGGADSPVLDLGCGRGEWLEVLREGGFTASGVDFNTCMIDQCRERGLEVVLADALEHLATLPDGSCGAVTAFHVIEHLSFSVLFRFFNECRRVLRPGGLAIFETPNPGNVLVGSCYFYLDYTHVRPLPSGSTRFLVEQAGFAAAEVVPLHPWPDEARVHGDGTNPELVARFNELFYGPQDYAIVARAPGGR